MTVDKLTIGYSSPAKKSGETLYWAPAGTTVPVDATTELDAAFVDCGHLSEEGFTKVNPNSDSETVNVDGKIPVEEMPGDYTPAWTMSLAQYSDLQANKITYGAENVDGTADAFHVAENADNKTIGVFVIERIHGKGRFIDRTVIPHGTLRLAGDIVHNVANLTLIPVRITATADDTGNASHKYTAKADAVQGLQSFVGSEND